MPSINLDADYLTHPKTLRLVALIGEGAEIYPIRLWICCAKYYANGMLQAMLDSEVEFWMGWRGEKGVLVSAMIEVGFLEKRRQHLVVHGWKEREGHIEAFQKRARSAAKTRWAKYATSNAKPMQQAMLSDAKSNALTIPTKPTKPIGKSHARIFQKPTPQEVTEYALSIGFNLNGQKFCDHYEIGGWVYGKSRTPIKDWKAAVRYWKSTDSLFGNKQPEKPRRELIG